MLIVYKIYFMQGLIFTYFYLNTFLLHKCKIHAFTFPQVGPHPLPLRIVLCIFLFLIALAYFSPASHHIKSAQVFFS